MSKQLVEGVVVGSFSSVTKNGSPYQNVSLLTLPNGSPISVSVWGAKKPFPYGKFFSAYITDKDGFISCFVDSVTISEPSEEFASLLPKPVSFEQFQSVARSLSALMSIDESSVFCAAVDSLLIPYSKGTAARSNHHNYIGGLLTHTYDLLIIFNSIYDALPFPVNPFIVSISALFHDYGKLSEYDDTLNYKPALFLQGHSFLSAEAVGLFLRKFKYQFITPSLIQHVQHCVLAHHGRLEFGAPVLPCSPEAFLVSKLDELSGIGVQFNKPSGTKVHDITIQRYNPSL